VLVSESDRNRLLKRQRALLLAASDMEQAAAAAKALADEADRDLARALETAIAVCYARAFTQSSIYQLSRQRYEPTDPRLAELHNELFNVRDKVYAHTDKKGGRTVSLSLQAVPRFEDLGKKPVRIDFGRLEEWVPMPREVLPVALELFHAQRTRFHDEASRIYIALLDPEKLPQ
jgi:hypothetical protein